ncbi:MAG: hypothetical protein ABIP39_15715 [Polyangiaceae bacterium]
MSVFVGALACPSLVRAQGASSQAAAQALFDEGKRLMTAGALAEACPKFAESQKLDPGAGTLLNLAACYERNGQSASAWATYTEAAVAAEKSNRADWATKARTKANAIQPTLSKLSILVPHTSETAGLEVKRDGALVGGGEWAVAIPVDPGPHVVEASAPNKKKWTTTVQVGTKKDQVAVSVPSLEDSTETPVAVPAPAPVPITAHTTAPPAPVEAADGSTQRTLGLAVIGVGVVGAALGTVFGLNATSKHNDAKANCNADQSACTSMGVDQMKDARSAATLSTVAFIVGGAAIAGGAVLYLTAPKKERSSTLQALHVSPSGTGVVLGGAW